MRSRDAQIKGLLQQAKMLVREKPLESSPAMEVSSQSASVLQAFMPRCQQRHVQSLVVRRQSSATLLWYCSQPENAYQGPSGRLRFPMQFQTCKKIRVLDVGMDRLLIERLLTRPSMKHGYLAARGACCQPAEV